MFHFVANTKFIHWLPINKILYLYFYITTLTLSWRRSLSYRKQPIDLLCKSMDWLLYDKGLCHERVNPIHDTCLFLYPLKTWENQRVSDVFRGYRKRPEVWKWVKPLLIILSYFIIHYILILYIFNMYYILHHKPKSPYLKVADAG